MIREAVVVASPLGKLGLTVVDGRLVKLEFLPRTAQLTPVSGLSEVTTAIVNQLRQYWRDPTTVLDFPSTQAGTALQHQIWQALQRIPCGQVVTYGALAQQLHTSPRVIGNACRRNQLPLVIPCHRVLSKGGLGGYCGKLAGELVEIKQWLLNHERKIPQNRTPRVC